MAETSFRPRQPNLWAKIPKERTRRKMVLPVFSHHILVSVDEKKSSFNWNSKINVRVWYLVLRVLCFYSYWMHIYGLAMALSKLLKVLKWPTDSVIAKGFLLKCLELFLAAYLPEGRSIGKMKRNVLCIAMPAACHSPK